MKALMYLDLDSNKTKKYLQVGGEYFYTTDQGELLAMNEGGFVWWKTPNKKTLAAMKDPLLMINHARLFTAVWNETERQQRMTLWQKIRENFRERRRQ